MAPLNRASLATLVLWAALLPIALAGQHAPTGGPLGLPTNYQSFDERLKDLEARRQRQLNLGLAEDAAETGRQIEAITREHLQTCSQWWILLERGQRPTSMKEAKENLRVLEEFQKNLQRYAGCGERPGAAVPDDVAFTAADEFTLIRNQIETQDYAVRSPLFVEPILSTASDFDTPSPAVAAFGKAFPAQGRNRSFRR